MGSASNPGLHSFRDQRWTSWDFVSTADEVLVRCPRCDACAKVVHLPRHGQGSGLRRLVCTACGYTSDKHLAGRWVLPSVLSRPERRGTVRDPIFRLPLWLQTDCRGHVLWAYNQRHLDYLEAFVSARLRLRSQPDPDTGWHRRMTMTAKLPKWLKAAKNREAVLHRIARLRRSIQPA
ncbi:hypothetical protein FNH05_28275 [Amycolatopsis rhizosphaerae]|uniref:TFIIB-type zinc ribbon-containing protein n=1 Tax=Amycolatopsis rhizosphaerae TaxID=2053003 RepID=A0A558B4Q9_9PSEU|nr:hypothetical protein [Amycolatopsis rhizosphaerae]TVT31497.1 hypothetical protein FNH05_28275 [Amycolatopsis rhizosphaerae]